MYTIYSTLIFIWAGLACVVRIITYDAYIHGHTNIQRTSNIEATYLGPISIYKTMLSLHLFRLG